MRYSLFSRPAAWPAKAFTLIELLIVVAIIAILAAIAVPNFLEAQTRAKVSTVKSDLRTVATALEAYAVDQTGYPPNDGLYGEIPASLSTPIAYLTVAKLVDPFAKDFPRQVTADLRTSPIYTYHKILTLEEAQEREAGGITLPTEAIDHESANPGALEQWGKWRLLSVGPDRAYVDPALPGPLHGSDIAYDPTNGSLSFGNITRTQKSPEG